jgi:hypothetical protein
MMIVRAIVTRAGWATIWYGSEDDKRLEQLAAQVQALQQQVNTLQTMVQTAQSQTSSPSAMAATVLDPFVSVEPGGLNGLAGPHVIFSGANFHIRSGSGKTDDNTGLGNLVIGYDEDELEFIKIDTTKRNGSHNVIVGPLHQFTASGGLVAGRNNTISGQSASVTGGAENTASGAVSSVSGGAANTASGPTASVSGGQRNTASGQAASVSGGEMGEADGQFASVGGGSANRASGRHSSVSGGRDNVAAGLSASISGGAGNVAEGNDSSISGGTVNRTSVSAQQSSVGGGVGQNATLAGQNIN